MGWDPALVPDPQHPDTFTRSKLDWSEVGNDGHARLHRLYRDLLRLRRTVPELTEPDFRNISVDFDEISRWLTIHRGDVVVALNFADSPRELPVPVSGEVQVLLETAPVLTYDGAVELPGYGAAILSGPRNGQD